MKLYYFAIIAFLFPFTVSGQGLKIQGNNFFIDDRTCYTVFEKIQPAFKEKLILDFEIALQDLTGAYASGYILRIKNKETNTTYNILYNGQGEKVVFNFNHEGKDVLAVAELDKEKFHEQQWITFSISFDLKNDSLILQIDDSKFYASGLALEPEWKPCIHFGRSEHVIDIPTFAIRKFTISDNEKRYYFPLNEKEGEAVHDSHKKIVGHVSNPNWLINDAYYWNFKTSFQSKSVAGSFFDSDRQEIYYVNKDSLTIYNVRSGETHTHGYSNLCPMTFQLGTCFIDKEKKRLYVYDVVLSANREDATIIYLDLENYSWTTASNEVLPTQLHHHSNFFDEVNRRYIIFGGFGNTLYNKEFFSYDLDENKWSILNFEGDKITPRYFSSMGYQKSKNVLYLFGGMGNESGYQSVGRIYYYDLYKIDLNTNEIIKLWEIPWRKENVVPVRNMVINDDSVFYTLCYPEHFSKSLLRLYRFSLTDGSYEIMGDSIPIVSEKITTHANLYHNTSSNEIYSIVQEFECDDIASTAKIYAISFPPATIDELTAYSEIERMSLSLFIAILSALLIAIALMVVRIRKRNKKKSKIHISKKSIVVENVFSYVKPPHENRANAIYLFGEFSIIDKHNREINYMLSTKLKQAFFLIMQYSLEHGITSQEFSELLWPNKSEDKVKNSRGVTLNNLRKIIGELDGIKLIHEKGSFKIIFTDECYCDYIRCIEIISGNAVDAHLDELVSIISRGKFLQSVDVPLLDSFKDIMEQKVWPALFVGMEKSFTSGHYSVVIQLSEGIFNIDPLSEDAIYYMINSLVKLKMMDEAKKRYFLFSTEYKKTLDEDYPKSFKELIN